MSIVDFYLNSVINHAFGSRTTWYIALGFVYVHTKFTYAHTQAPMSGLYLFS